MSYGGTDTWGPNVGLLHKVMTILTPSTNNFNNTTVKLYDDDLPLLYAKIS